jgi:hydroxymethylbilane synthase
MVTPLRIGTRGSPLALAQAHMVADALRAAHGWDEDAIEIVPITTSGDLIQDRPLAEVGGKALWTKELDRCLAEGRTDLSVHSMKDVETIRPGLFAVAAMLARADTRDRLIGAVSIAALPEGARVGTSSPRRAAQLRARRPDLQPLTIRGNVQTRLAKVERGDFDATLLAAAGLERLGMTVGAAIDDMLPAPSQGAIGVEILAARADLSDLLAPIDHSETHLCVEAERALLAALGGDCHSAVAALARAEDGVRRLRAEILNADGSEVQAGAVALDDPDAPARLAKSLLDTASPALRAIFER